MKRILSINIDYLDSGGKTNNNTQLGSYSINNCFSFLHIPLKMFKIPQKVKKLVEDRNTPIDAGKAMMVALTGTTCSKEDRFNAFIIEINKEIDNISKFGGYYHLVTLPPDLICKRDLIMMEFTNREFIVHELVPENKEVFVISWKYA